MKNCANCQNPMPATIVIDGKRRNLCCRRYCLECSPFGVHNTRRVHINKIRVPHSRDYKTMSLAQRKAFNAKHWPVAKQRRREKRIKLVIEAGGKCSRCGYSKNYACLSFHHREPKKKLFTLDTRGLQSRSDSEIKLELRKCDLMCLNCHQEEHHPDLMVLPVGVEPTS